MGYNITCPPRNIAVLDDSDIAWHGFQPLATGLKLFVSTSEKVTNKWVTTSHVHPVILQLSMMLATGLKLFVSTSGKFTNKWVTISHVYPEILQLSIIAVLQQAPASKSLTTGLQNFMSPSKSLTTGLLNCVSTKNIEESH
jgi:hypothetical protein